MTETERVPDGGQRGGRVVARKVPPDERSRPSNTVLAALDSLPGYDLETSDHVLADSIDPDALDALFRSRDEGRRDSGRVVFPLASYLVTVKANGEVVVTTSGSPDP